MALFSKKQDNKNTDVPPMPPATPNVSSEGQNSQVGNIPAPTSELNNLSVPPVPGGNLADIKTQVESQNQFSAMTPQTIVPTASQAQNTVPTNEEEFDDESLFDFSELEVQTPIEAEKREEINSDSDSNSDEEKEQEKKELNYEDDPDLKFINRRNRNKIISETYFVTTKQFKSLLEIVDSVKLKVKNSAETHLKLLDMKAEEDIEFENLRKDFQFIEDKLYEVDNLIFEK